MANSAGMARVANDLVQLRCGDAVATDDLQRQSGNLVIVFVDCDVCVVVVHVSGEVARDVSPYHSVRKY